MEGFKRSYIQKRHYNQVNSIIPTPSTSFGLLDQHGCNRNGGTLYAVNQIQRAMPSWSQEFSLADCVICSHVRLRVHLENLIIIYLY